MPAIRDGRGVLHVHDMGVPPPGSANGPVERRFVTPVADALPARIHKESDAAAMAQSRRRGAQRHVEVVRAQRAKEEPVPPRVHAHGDRATETAPIDTRAAHLEKLRSVLTPRQQEVIDLLRELGSRRAVQAKLGLSHLQSIDGSLVDAAEKGLLPADLPDLPKRVVKALAAGTLPSRKTTTPAAELVSNPVRNIPKPIPAVETAEPARAHAPSVPDQSRHVADPPIGEDGLPCDACGHRVVCGIRAELADWVAELAAPTPPHPAIRVLAKVLVTCDHYLETP